MDQPGHDTDDRPTPTDGQQSASGPLDAKSGRRRHARWLLFGGAAAVLLLGAELGTGLPTERTIVVRTDPAAGVHGLELTWHEGGRAVHVSRIAPPIDGARSAVRLADGQHELELTVRRSGAVTRSRRRIEVREGATTIVVAIP